MTEEYLNLRVAVAGYNAQYGARSLAEQHPELPSGAIARIEALYAAAKTYLDSEPAPHDAEEWSWERLLVDLGFSPEAARNAARKQP